MSSSKTIVIVDDDKGIREVLTTLLEAKSYEVKDFEHGYDAIDFVKKNKAQMVLLDYFLPGENAESIVRSLKEVESSAVILLMSASMHVKMDLKKNGIAEFIKKPFSIDLIYDTVDKYIH